MSKQVGRYRQLNSKSVRKVCDYLRQGLTLKQACAQANVRQHELEGAIASDNPGHPHWQLWVKKARAEFVAYWMDRLDKAETGPEVQKCKAMLAATDRRFRSETKDGGQGGPQVIFMTRPAAERALELPVKVIEETPQLEQ